MPPSHLFSASLVITRPVTTIAVSVNAEQAAIALALRALAARGSLPERAHSSSHLARGKEEE
jgi:hypothetical protein